MFWLCACTVAPALAPDFSLLVLISMFASHARASSLCCCSFVDACMTWLLISRVPCSCICSRLSRYQCTCLLILGYCRKSTLTQSIARLAIYAINVCCVQLLCTPSCYQKPHAYAHGHMHMLAVQETGSCVCATVNMHVFSPLGYCYIVMCTCVHVVICTVATNQHAHADSCNVRKSHPASYHTHSRATRH